jgi:putative ABC transport system permease protein
VKFLPLVWAGLWRKPVRTALAMISVAIAFWLSGTLDGVTAAFGDALVSMTDAARMRTQSRVNVRAGLPLAYRARIESVAGVRDVGMVTFVGGYYRDSVDFIEVAAIDITRVDAGGSFDVDPAYVEQMRRVRTGAVIGPELVRRYGWKIGDRVTVKSPMWAKADGSNDWTFDIVGVYGIPEGAFPADGNFWINYDYFDEGRQFAKGTVTFYTLRVHDADRAAAIGAEIDALFANSADETLTQSERDFFNAQIERVGNIGFIVNSIIGAVLFALLFVTGNTMMQSIRERVPELAVLKTYGFSNLAVNLLVFAESALLCVTAAVVGLSVAAVLFPTMFEMMGVAPIPMERSTLVRGVGVAIALAAVSSWLPTWRAQRLNVVDALAGR